MDMNTRYGSFPHRKKHYNEEQFCERCGDSGKRLRKFDKSRRLFCNRKCFDMTQGGVERGLDNLPSI